MNTNVSTPMVNQEMLESVFGGASNLENGAYDYEAVTDYLTDEAVETSGFHIDAGIFFKVLRIDLFRLKKQKLSYWIKIEKLKQSTLYKQY